MKGELDNIRAWGTYLSTIKYNCDVIMGCLLYTSLLEAYRFQSLTPRSFCGALLGWMLPYWRLFGHAFFYNEMELFYRPFNQLLAFGEVFNLQICLLYTSRCV